MPPSPPPPRSQTHTRHQTSNLNTILVANKFFQAHSQMYPLWKMPQTTVTPSWRRLQKLYQIPVVLQTMKTIQENICRGKRRKKSLRDSMSPNKVTSDILESTSQPGKQGLFHMGISFWQLMERSDLLGFQAWKISNNYYKLKQNASQSITKEVQDHRLLNCFQT